MFFKQLGTKEMKKRFVESLLLMFIFSRENRFWMIWSLLGIIEGRGDKSVPRRHDQNRCVNENMSACYTKFTWKKHLFYRNFVCIGNVIAAVTSTGFKITPGSRNFNYTKLNCVFRQISITQLHLHQTIITIKSRIFLMFVIREKTFRDVWKSFRAVCSCQARQWS